MIEQQSAKLVFQTDGTFTREDFARIRIQSDAGVQTYDVLTFPYANSESTLQVDFVRVLKPDGTRVDTPLENIQDMASEITRQAPFYSDVREKHIAVKGLGTGDSLEFKTRLTNTKPLAPGKFWFAYSFTDQAISLDEQLEVNVPVSSAIKIATPRVKPEISTTGKYRTYRWHFSNLHQKPKEDQQVTTYYQARGRLPEPDIQISNFQSWDEVGRWYNDLQKDRVKPTPEIQAKAAQLTKDATDDTAKLQAIYKYVSTEFHYIGIAFGIGRYQPHSAAEVLANQYGDCKDKHTLLASLLTAAGFEVYPALISSSHQIDPEVPSPGQFDHVITAVQRGNDLLWLDSTPEVAPFGYLISPLWGKQALVMYSGKPASLVVTSTAPLGKSTSLFRIEAKLADSGVLEGKIDRIRSGDDFEVIFRSAFRRTPFPQWKDLIQQISYASGFAGDVSEVSASSPEAIETPFKFSYKYSRKDYPDWANRKIDPPLPPLGLPALPDDDDKLSAPLWLGAPGEHKYISEVELPKGYRPELPVPVDVKSEFADYHASSENRGGKLITTRVLTIKLAEVPTKDYEEYKKFKKQADEDHDALIALSSGIASGPQIMPDFAAALPSSDNAEAMRSFQKGANAVRGHETNAQIAAFKNAVEIDPKFTRAWIALGSAYLSAQKMSLGLDAFHKAIDVDPQQPAPYKMLGLALFRMRNYEQSIPVWQKVIALSPQDVDGPSNLGYAYLWLKNYKDAVKQFEFAVKILPDRPFLQMQLGTSYLRAGFEEKGVGAFQKAMDMDPGTGMLNSVAYELADFNVRLPDALRYAQKAVQDTEDLTAKINLSGLKVEDLRAGRRLAFYWDTLGWIYFRMGDYQKARDYLESSWDLGLDCIVADHLGQVDEKLGDKEAARKMYRMAIAVSLAYPPGWDRDAVEERLRRVATAGAPHVDVNDEIHSYSMIKMPRLTPGQATAEFFFLFSAQGKSPSFLEDISFISGSEKLRPVSKRFMSMPFKVHIPETSRAKIVRRGMLGCYEYTGCSLYLLPPVSVNSVD